MMVTRLEMGETKEQAATFAYTSTAFPMLTGTLVTVAGFVPIGLNASSAGEYTFTLFAGDRGGNAGVVDRRGAVRTGSPTAHREAETAKAHRG